VRACVCVYCDVRVCKILQPNSHRLLEFAVAVKHQK